MNEFAGYYKTLSTAELLSIVTNPDHYQKRAVDAARYEIDARQLSMPELDAAYDELRHRSSITTLQLQQQQLEREKYLGLFRRLIQRISPFTNDLTQAERTVRRIVLLFGLIFLIEKILHFQELVLTFGAFFSFPFGAFLYLYPDVLLVLALIYLHNLSPSGWTLFCFYCIHMSFMTLLAASPYLFSYDIGIYPGIIVNTILCLTLHIGALFLLSTEPVRELYYVHKKKMHSIFVKCILISAVMLGLIYYYVTMLA